MSDQATFDGMPTRLFSCTPTRLDTWLTCPRRYRFSYLEKRPKVGAWAHSSMGAAVHNALRDLWSLPLERRTPDEAASLVESAWIGEGFRDDAQSAQWRSHAAAMTAEYVEGIDPADEPVGVERTVSVTANGMALQGRVDRIDRRRSADGGEELVVVDYKTGRRPLSDDDARSSLALAIYVHAAARTLRTRARRVELHHLPTRTVAAFEHTPESVERHLARAGAIAAEARDAETVWKERLAPLAEAAASGEADAVEAIDEVLPPRPESSCSWCDFRRHCPEGSAVSVELKPWSGLADLTAPVEPAGSDL
jgi:putative RecB family exonuclease